MPSPHFPPETKSPLTAEESMAAALLGAAFDMTWRQAATLLAENPSPLTNTFMRMAAVAVEHIPYIERLVKEQSMSPDWTETVNWVG